MRVVGPRLLQPPVKGIHYLLAPHRRHLTYPGVGTAGKDSRHTTAIRHAIPCHVAGI